MTGFEMFCERCGTRYGSEESTAVDALPLRRRLLIAVGVAESPPPPPIEEPLLSFCLACRGYSCHACWNDAAGFCQTCVPLPEPEFVAMLEPEPLPEVQPILAVEPAFITEPDVEPEPVALADPEPHPEAPAEPLVLAFADEAIAAATPELLDVAAAMSEVESEPLFVAETVAEPEPASAVAFTEVESEPPLPVFTYEEIAYAEPEPEVHFDWSLEDEPPVLEAAAESAPSEAAAEKLVAAAPEVEAEPILAEAERIAVEADPIAVAAEPISVEAEPVEAGAEPIAVESEPVAADPEPGAPAPEIYYTPDVPPVPVWPAPVFRPLEPMGPIVPPPPPALQVPRMAFDLPDAPPAFLIARQPMTPASLPVLPAGLFDGPAPAIRPCATCDLPVSAKARFCRRCGSSQA